MPSEVDVAKRELVEVLNLLAAKYGVPVSLRRDSADKDVHKTFRKVALKAHSVRGACKGRSMLQNICRHGVYIFIVCCLLGWKLGPNSPGQFRFAR